MNKLIILITALSIIYSCHSPSSYDKVKSFYESKKTGNFSKFKFLVVINEGGSCLNCNNIFSKTISSSISNSDILFIVSGSGTKVDISDYTDKSYSNVIWDFENSFQNFNLTKKCAIFRLKNKILQEKTEINPDNVLNIKYEDIKLGTIVLPKIKTTD